MINVGSYWLVFCSSQEVCCCAWVIRFWWWRFTIKAVKNNELDNKDKAKFLVSRMIWTDQLVTQCWRLLTQRSLKQAEVQSVRRYKKIFSLCHYKKFDTAINTSRLISMPSRLVHGDAAKIQISVVKMMGNRCALVIYTPSWQILAMCCKFWDEFWDLILTYCSNDSFRRKNPDSRPIHHLTRFN